MILRALYDLAQAEGLVDDPDYVQQEVAYYLSLGEGGENPRLVSVMEERLEGKRTILELRRIAAPREPSRSGTRAPALFLLDKASYLFGLGPDKGDSGKLKSFPQEAARFLERVRGVRPALPIGSIDERAISALISFLERPEGERNRPLLDAYEAAPSKREKDPLVTKPIYIIFAPEGVTPLHRMPAIQMHWRDLRASLHASGVVGSCSITGQLGPLAERHTFLKGVPGATSAGVPLVSFNSKAFESYGLEGNENARVGRIAAEGYAAGLNRLLESKPRTPDGVPLGRQNLRLSDDTVAVFWCREPSDLSWLGLLSDSPDSVAEMLRSPRSGRRPPLEDPEGFFTLVLSGAQGRAIIRSCVTSTTAEVASNVNRYLDQTRIVRPYDVPGCYPLRDVLRSLAPLGDDKRLPPRLATEVYLAAVTGSKFPFVVLESAIRRNRVEGPDGRPFAARCSVIRGALLRQQTYKEDLTVSLDLTNRQPAYLLGRLLAVIDHIQQDALGSVNASLVDRYYGSASSTPGVVFPSLLRRSQHHLSKLRKEKTGLAVNREKLLQEAMGGLQSFPRTLTLQAQGLFALGFHHQRQAFFTKTPTDEPTN